MAKKKKKKCKDCKNRVRTVMGFAMLYPTHMGTPKVGGMGGNTGGGPGGRDAQGMATPILSPATPSGPAEAIESMRRVFKPLLENDPTYAGFQVPLPGMVKMRQGGPSLSGPGFEPGDKLPGGNYDLEKSPGLGFRSDAAFRIWKAALRVILKDPTLDKNAILTSAIQQAGVKPGELDPGDAELLAMGIDAYLATGGVGTTPKGPPVQGGSG